MGIVTLLPFVCACACCDLKTRRIPNALIWCGLAGALLSRFPMAAGLNLFPACLFSCFDRGLPAAASLSRSASGPSFAAFCSSLASGFIGFLLPWLIFGVLAALKMIGGGDVKLLSVIGLQLGSRSCLQVIWYSLIFGAVWSVVIVIRRRNLSQRLNYLYRYVQASLSCKKMIRYRSPAVWQQDLTPAPGHTHHLSGHSSILTQTDQSGEFCFAVVILTALLFVLSGAPDIFLKGGLI